MTMLAINPANGQTIEEYDEMAPDAVARAIEDANRAFQSWRRTTFGERAELMKSAARVLREDMEEYTVLMANEMGKRYRCPKCGAEFIVTKGGEGTINCCGQPMELKK